MHSAQSDSDPKVIGQWELLEATFQGSATHVALLPTNEVFAYGGSSLDIDAFRNPPPAEILDLGTMETRQISMEGVEGDIWCGGHTFLADGKLIFAGGTSAYPNDPDPLYGGSRQAYIYDPFNEKWLRLGDMREGRWYPTLIRLPDNSVLAVSGLRYRAPEEPETKKNALEIIFELIFRIKQRIASVQEVYSRERQRWGEMKERRFFPLYPRLHLLPDGDIFYSGVFNTHYFVPGRYPSSRWNHISEEWLPVGGQHINRSREEGISLLLALRPPHYRAQILVIGGGHHNFPRTLISLLHSAGLSSLAGRLRFSATALSSVEFIDLSEPQPRWRPLHSMHLPRIHANGVLLPDGKVLVVGGMPSHAHETTEPVIYPVLPAEMYDPEKDEWALMDTPCKPRVYHSTAILVPDGRVVSMGSNPLPRMIERKIEIYSPPYLFMGERPAILQYPEVITYGQSFTLGVEKVRQISQVVMMRPEVVTHVTNTDQRLLELEFKVLNNDYLEVKGPPSAGHMPQGYSLLFVLNLDGVPSVGKFVRVV